MTAATRKPRPEPSEEPLSTNPTASSSDRLPSASSSHLYLETKRIIWLARILILMFLLNKCMSAGQYDNNGVYYEEINDITYRVYPYQRNPNFEQSPYLESMRRRYFIQHGLDHNLPLGTRRQIRRLTLALDWPTGIQWGKRSNQPNLVAAHISQNPNKLVIHGLWADEQNERPVMYCNDFLTNYGRMNNDRGLIESTPEINTYWPSFKAPTESFQFWTNEWVSKRSPFKGVHLILVLFD